MVETGSVVVVYVKADGTVVTQVVGEGEMFDAATGKVRAMTTEEKADTQRKVQSLKGMAAAPVVVEDVPVIFISPALGR
jgi:hypothetical protein